MFRGAYLTNGEMRCRFFAELHPDCAALAPDWGGKLAIELCFLRASRPVQGAAPGTYYVLVTVGQQRYAGRVLVQRN